jgi:cellulose synthase/poly-beta-1,6-N-acetylglucosamine synthase-like glycosyltransferase
MLYFSCLGFIFLYSLVQLNLVWAYRKRSKEPALVQEEPSEWPKVTVQLPIYNERYVSERLIDAVTRLDYPADCLEIQVLDDSTDDTSSIISSAVGHYQAEGIRIQHIQRTTREGFKAGALAYGMLQSRGSLLAIFDADFIPPRDFLKRTVPHFIDASVGVVQTRWMHLNEDYNTLTRLQAFGLDAHFTVEQGGRHALGSYINFNGTAGVWRRSCIEDAGGWSSDTLTEDLDLSYRAQLKGWRFVYREDVGAPAELPAAMTALKTQQYRWTKGAAECTMKNLGKVWRKDGLGWSTKVNALFHLMNSFIFISVLLTSLLSIQMLFVKARTDWSISLFAAGSLFLTSMFILAYFYWVSQRRMHPDQGVISFLSRFFLFLSMSMGLSLHNAIAVLEGYLGRKTPFVRTPKFNIVAGEGSWRNNLYLNKRIGWMPLLEIALSVLFAWAIYQGIGLGDWGLVPFHFLLMIGFALVGWTTVQHQLASSRSSA